MYSIIPCVDDYAELYDLFLLTHGIKRYIMAISAEFEDLHMGGGETKCGISTMKIRIGFILTAIAK